jgi:dihydrofolate synthase/folylpolyglutamate synthase
MNSDEYKSAVDYLHGLTAFGMKLGLERFAALCERLGDPQKKLKCVHVAGTNGKGSTTAMIVSILRSAGYHVGAYFSPYVYDVRERVQVDGDLIEEDALVRLVDVIRPHVSALAETDFGHPTEFEVKTALAFLYFVEQKVDFAVLEVGMGGRLDATNIVNPLVSVITNVTIDHTEHLGNTVREIAGEKAGIIKENGHLITAATDSDALDVIRRICEERGSDLWLVNCVDGAGDQFEIRPVEAGCDMGEMKPGSQDAEAFAVRGVNRCYPGLMVRLKGAFQFVNAATAIGAVEALEKKGFEVGEASIREGLKSAYLPGRMEVLRRDPILLIDGAHNLDGACQVAAALENQFKYEKLILVMGMVSGHSIENVVGTLARLADKFIATASSSPRAACADTIAAVARMYCTDVTVVTPVSEAVDRALELAGPRDLICVTGSFYTIGEVPRPQGSS